MEEAVRRAGTFFLSNTANCKLKLMFSYGGCGDMSYGGRVGLAHVLVSLDGVTKALVA